MYRSYYRQIGHMSAASQITEQPRVDVAFLLEIDRKVADGLAATIEGALERGRPRADRRPCRAERDILRQFEEGAVVVRACVDVLGKQPKIGLSSDAIGIDIRTLSLPRQRSRRRGGCSV